ncbi:hypothetical protein YC2023_061061 [Brassica napus]
MIEQMKVKCDCPQEDVLTTPVWTCSKDKILWTRLCGRGSMDEFSPNERVVDNLLDVLLFKQMLG